MVERVNCATLVEALSLEIGKARKKAWHKTEFSLMKNFFFLLQAKHNSKAKSNHTCKQTDNKICSLFEEGEKNKANYASSLPKTWPLF